MFFASLFLSGFLTVPPVPGDYCTPHDPDFKEYRYAEKVPYCNRNVMSWDKDRICERDGVEDRERFTVDHIIPLSLGGNNSEDNLWCQHRSLNVTGLEYEMYLDLRDGKKTQEEAVRVILEAKFQE